MRFKHLGIAVLALVSMVGVAFAQTGTVTGQVFDPGGALVPGASVTVTSESTGLTRTSFTTSAGIYNFAALPPSVYTVTVQAPGFETISRKNVVLNVAATLPVNFTLSLAGAVASVDVQEVTVAPVETGSFQLSTVIDSEADQRSAADSARPVPVGSVVAGRGDGHEQRRWIFSERSA